MLKTSVGSVASAHLLATGIDDLELFHRGHRDVVPGNFIVFLLELSHVDPCLVDVASAVGNDAGLEQRLDQDTKDIRVVGHVRAAILLRERLEDCTANPLPVEIEFFVDLLLLFRIDQVEQQDLESFRCPELDVLVFFLAELRNRAVCPDLSEFVMESLVGHRELDQSS